MTLLVDLSNKSFPTRSSLPSYVILLSFLTGSDFFSSSFPSNESMFLRNTLYASKLPGNDSFFRFTPPTLFSRSQISVTRTADVPTSPRDPVGDRVALFSASYCDDYVSVIWTISSAGLCLHTCGNILPLPADFNQAYTLPCMRSLLTWTRDESASGLSPKPLPAIPFPSPSVKLLLSCSFHIAV